MKKRTRNITAKQTAFVKEYLTNGRRGADAYRKAIDSNVTDKQAQDRASRLLATSTVGPLIEEAVAAAKKEVIVTVAKIQRELVLLGFANMFDFIKVNEEGLPYVDFTGLTRDKAAAIHEVTVDSYMDGKGEDARQVKRVKFKLAPKIEALHLLGKNLGMFDKGASEDGADKNTLTIVVKNDPDAY